MTHFFTAYQHVAAAGEEAFVPLDDGLAIMSKHAQGLGYDAVILFLDELILWLASHVADMGFVSREGQKLAKLVEATTADRPIPLISFVARQRDLRELVGDHVPGAEKLAFVDVLKYWEGRFHQITLEDRNLPAIAEKRVLRPRSEAARQALDGAFEETKKIREEAMRVLLTSDADQRMFRAVYPFSPALVQTLVAVSSALQRERTALKVMFQLLVSQRDTLALGDLVPVGDLFDVIAEGDEPFTEDMRIHFENAKRLYRQKLLPLIEKQREIRAEEVRRLTPGDPKATAFRADDRIIKTLLLAALVPEVESLKGMTGGRLAALNHGTIRSPIPGREGAIVLGKCRQWASQVGEIKIGDDPANPTIAIQITGVDMDAIVEAAPQGGSLSPRLRRVGRPRRLPGSYQGGPTPPRTGLSPAALTGLARHTLKIIDNLRRGEQEQLAGASAQPARGRRRATRREGDDTFSTLPSLPGAGITFGYDTIRYFSALEKRVPDDSQHFDEDSDFIPLDRDDPSFDKWKQQRDASAIPGASRGRSSFNGSTAVCRMWGFRRSSSSRSR